MISLRYLTLIVSCSVFGGLLYAAEPAADSSKAKSASSTNSLAGNYVGTWESGSDGGQLKLKFAQAGGVWSADVTFSVGEAQVQGKVASLNVTATKVDMVVDWQIESTSGQSHITGELAGDKLDGIYDSKTSEGTSNGTWSATRK